VGSDASPGICEVITGIGAVVATGSVTVAGISIVGMGIKVDSGNTEIPGVAVGKVDTCAARMGAAATGRLIGLYPMGPMARITATSSR